MALCLGQERIGFKAIQLMKDQTLGFGSYGKVYRAKCDSLDCAAKVLHETLCADPNTALMAKQLRTEHRLPLKRFEKECEILMQLRHPNIIQYLGMHHTEDARPVLLMELMDCNLTNYLEDSQSEQQSIPFRIQVNISHDVTLALSFLHSNGIIHRDLSGNNVLLSGQPNVRAKVTDFGMATLSDQLSHQHVTRTMCPGTDVYMPPEAVSKQVSYTMKLDCFSFGVILIQIMTKKFPTPIDRLREIEIAASPTMPGIRAAFVQISEYERRKEHIDEADQSNPLLPIALKCLKDNDVERPSAQWLCEEVGKLRGVSRYRESVTHAQLENKQQQGASIATTSDTSSLCELKEKIQKQEFLIEDLQQACQSQVKNFDHQLALKTEMIKEKEETIAQTMALVQEKEKVLTRAENELRLTREQLQAMSLDKQRLDEEIAAQKLQQAQKIQGLQSTIQSQGQDFKEMIEQKDQQLSKQKKDLDERGIALTQKETLLLENEEIIHAGQMEIKRLKQQLDQERTNRVKLQKEQAKCQGGLDLSEYQIITSRPAPGPVVDHASNRAEPRVKNLSLRWEGGWNLPCSVERGCDAVVKDTIVYFVAAGSAKVYNFNSSDNTCFQLPECPFHHSSLAIVDDQLISVGGSLNVGGAMVRDFTNKLFSFTDAGLWIEKLPHMPTKRDSTASLALATRKVLIVIGGRNRGGGNMSVVEVLNTETLQWSSAPNLPMPLRDASATICGGDVYVLGGVDRGLFGSKTVFACSANALVKVCEPKSFGARLLSTISSPNLWYRVADLSVTKSTCISFCGCLLAVGGEDDNFVPTKAIHMYDPALNTWKVASNMSVARSNCVVATLPGNRLMVGGRAGAMGRNKNVEFASISQCRTT